MRVYSAIWLAYYIDITHEHHSNSSSVETWKLITFFINVYRIYLWNIYTENNLVWKFEGDDAATRKSITLLRFTPRLEHK